MKIGRAYGKLYWLLVFVIWYVVLNLINVDGMIAENVLSRAAENGLTQSDLDFVLHLSHDADSVREKYKNLLLQKDRLIDIID